MKSEDVIFRKGVGHFLTQIFLVLAMAVAICAALAGWQADWGTWLLSLVLSIAVFSVFKYMWNNSVRGKSWLVIFFSIALACVVLSWLMEAVKLGFAVGMPLAAVFATLISNMHPVADEFEHSLLESRLQ